MQEMYYNQESKTEKSKKSEKKMCQIFGEVDDGKWQAE